MPPDSIGLVPGQRSLAYLLQVMGSLGRFSKRERTRQTSSFFFLCFSHSSLRQLFACSSSFFLLFFSSTSFLQRLPLPPPLPLPATLCYVHRSSLGGNNILGTRSRHLPLSAHKLSPLVLLDFFVLSLFPCSPKILCQSLPVLD